MGTTPGAVSALVRLLEEELNAVLFERAKKSVTLTAAGKQFYALANPLVEEMTELTTPSPEYVMEELTGRLAIATSMVGGAVVLPPYVKRFRDRYPSVHLRVRNGKLGDGIARLQAGEVEFLLGEHEAPEDHSLEYSEVLSYDFVLIASPDHPLAGRETVSLQEAADWPAIVPPQGSCGWRFDETELREFGSKADVAVIVEGWGAIKACVEQGLGISAVPSLCVDERDQLSVISLGMHSPARSFGIYTRQDGTLTEPALRFLALMSSAKECTGERKSDVR